MPGVKFSQFINGGNIVPGDQLAGLRNGNNTIFSASIFNGNALTLEIPQAAHGFIVGEILRLNGTNYVLAQADNSVDAEVIGMVIDVIDVNHFVLLFNGYIFNGLAVTPGSVYFLSPTVPGAYTAVAPVAPGQIRKALFVADSAVSGFWLNYQGQQL